MQSGLGCLAVQRHTLMRFENPRLGKLVTGIRTCVLSGIGVPARGHLREPLDLAKDCKLNLATNPRACFSTLLSPVKFSSTLQECAALSDNAAK